MDDLPGLWDAEASKLEREAPASDASINARLQRMHARVKRACAEELRKALTETGWREKGYRRGR